jgi:hypothetical protein
VTLEGMGPRTVSIRSRSAARIRGRWDAVTLIKRSGPVILVPARLDMPLFTTASHFGMDRSSRSPD